MPQPSVPLLFPLFGARSKVRNVSTRTPFVMTLSRKSACEVAFVDAISVFFVNV